MDDKNKESKLTRLRRSLQNGDSKSRKLIELLFDGGTFTELGLIFGVQTQNSIPKRRRITISKL